MTSTLLSRLSLATGAAVAALLLVAAPSYAAGTTAPPSTQGLQYVALGDSYAAGFGIAPSTGAPVPGCQQADEDYPHQVAAQLGMSLTDVTCTGAVTANIVDTPQVTPAYFGGGTANPQLSALSADTDVVTVSIGGNDTGFSSIAATCIAETASGPVAGPDEPFTADNCQSIFVQDGVDTLAAHITTTVAANLANAYAAIAKAAPNAKVFVVGYPSLLPDAANTPPSGCFTSAFGDGPPYPQNSVPFTDVDVPYIHSIEVLLNQTIAAQAAAAGFTFIDDQPGSVAHSACPQDASPYINGVTIRSLLQEPYIEPGGLHPNTAGVAFLTAQTAPAIAAAFSTPAPTPTPTPSASSTPAGTALAATGADGSRIGALAAGGLLVVAAGTALVLLRARSGARRRGTSA